MRRSTGTKPGPATSARLLLSRSRTGSQEQAGSVIVIAMMFVMIFLVLGVALYLLVHSQTDSTELERTDVKAFNVAEAGVDAGMLGLKLAWPYEPPPATQAFVDNEVLKQAIKAGTDGLWDPTRASPSEFIQVTIYDNVDADGNTTTVPYAGAPAWDSNGDGKMFVDSTANVDNDRHRILILAERQQWQLTFARGMALYASEVDSNGQGLQVSIESPYPPPSDPYAYYEVHDVLRKGIDEGYGVAPTGSSTSFQSLVGPALQKALEGIARERLTYFETAAGVSEYLSSGQANGEIVYVKADTSVTIASNVQIGTVEKPTIVVIDTPDGSVNTWDMRGTADLYGILITFGDNELRGTCGIHGAVYSSGMISNMGTGASGEISYNEEVINNLNRQYVISVNIVPNTWEEYTLPRGAETPTTGAGG